MNKRLTVGDIRKAIDGMPDEAEVTAQQFGVAVMVDFNGSPCEGMPEPDRYAVVNLVAAEPKENGSLWVYARLSRGGPGCTVSPGWMDGYLARLDEMDKREAEIESMSYDQGDEFDDPDREEDVDAIPSDYVRDSDYLD